MRPTKAFSGVAHASASTSRQSRLVGGFGGSVLQVWPQPHVLGMGEGGAYPACMPPRIPRLESRAPVGGQTSRREGAAIDFLNRDGVALFKTSPTLGKLPFSSVEVALAIGFLLFCIPEMQPKSQDFARFFHESVFWVFAPLLLLFLLFIERETEVKMRGDGRKSVPRVSRFFTWKVFRKKNGDQESGTPKRANSRISGAGVSNEINGLGVFDGVIPANKKEMPPSPPRSLFFGGASHGQ